MKNKKTILIVEDDTAMGRALEDKFSREGLNVLREENGESGLEAALKEQPDIILTDIIMPRMDGLTMLKKLREDDLGKNIPVIVSTNLNEFEKIEESLQSGAFDFLVKSDWKLEDVVKKVKDRLADK